MKRLQYITVIICLLLFVKPLYGQSVNDSDEFQALKALYESAGGATWTNSTGWPTPGNWPATATAAEMSGWYGITVSNGDITEINLANNNLTGSLPVELGNLFILRKLALGSNHLTGTLPPEMANMVSLQYLYLNSNNLDGVFPQFLGRLTGLKNAYLNNNQLTGTLPDNLSNLNLLVNFKVYSNNLTGSIPQVGINSSSLSLLEFQNNNFTNVFDFTANANAASLTLNVSNNNLPYADIEANLNPDGTSVFSTFNFSNQGHTPMSSTYRIAMLGKQLGIESNDTSLNNHFTWQHKVGGAWQDVTTLNESATGDVFLINATTAADGGDYRYMLTNDILTGESKTSDPITIDVLNLSDVGNWAFQYKYDSRKRMVEKRVPGAGWVYMVYDNRDRLVLTQDSVQRKDSVWLFTKYDVLNRPVATGFYTNTDSLSQASMQNYVNYYYDNLSAGQDWYESVGATWNNYDNASFPQTPSEADYLTVTYYDNYLVSDTWGGYAYSDPLLSETVTTTNTTYPSRTSRNEFVNGQVTASMVKNLGDNTWLKTVTFYDEKYRIIQTLGDNNVGGKDRVSNLYDFNSKILQTALIHSDNATSYTSLQRNIYDHAGRLIEVKNKQGVEDEITLTSNTYNKLGELIEKNLHSTDDVTFAQSVDYKYNIRGWLTHINDVDDMTIEANALDDKFAMDLGYNEAINNISSSVDLQYNGNISAMRWKSGLIGQKEQGYVFAYDPMNRITKADSKVNDFGWGAGSFSMAIGDPVNSGYDLNGNIQNLTRSNENGVMDQLTYTYLNNGKSGNQLSSVEDSGNINEGFKDGNVGSDDYAYDGNGNMTEDKNKGIAIITYNYLNLPQKVEKIDGQYITYAYSAAGIKLSQEVHDSTGIVLKKTDYAGAYVYENDTLRFIQTAEGRIIPGTTSEYQYYLKDHLGNTRITFTTKGLTDTYLATMESENFPQEKEYVTIDSTTLTIYTAANHTPSGNEAQQLDEAHPVGASMMLPVAPGDTVNLEVYGYYEGGSGYNSTTSGALLTGIMDAFGGVNGGAGEAGAIYNGINSAIVDAGGFGGTSDDTRPAAYLNYIILDENFNYNNDNQFGFLQMPASASYNQELMSIPNIVIDKKGYIFVYLSYENETVNKRVFFDDLKVTHTEALPIIQSEDYYPFGLTFNSYQRPNTTEQNYQYNGKELQDELDVNWLDYGARMYNSSIGKWNAIDPLAETYYEYSSYGYVRNNPVNLFDIAGMADDQTFEEWNDQKRAEEEALDAGADPAKVWGLNNSLGNYSKSNSGESNSKEPDDGKKGKNKVNSAQDDQNGGRLGTPMDLANASFWDVIGRLREASQWMCANRKSLFLEEVFNVNSYYNNSVDQTLGETAKHWTYYPEGVKITIQIPMREDIKGADGNYSYHDAANQFWGNNMMIKTEAQFVRLSFLNNYNGSSLINFKIYYPSSFTQSNDLRIKTYNLGIVLREYLRGN